MKLRMPWRKNDGSSKGEREEGKREQFWWANELKSKKKKKKIRWIKISYLRWKV